jgi:hypothetical protein
MRVWPLDLSVGIPSIEPRRVEARERHRHHTRTGVHAVRQPRVFTTRSDLTPVMDVHLRRVDGIGRGEVKRLERLHLRKARSRSRCRITDSWRDACSAVSTSWR